MRHAGSRLRAYGLGALAVALLLAWWPTTAAGQARTPDGRPDLSGYWLGSFFVGLQNIETAKGVIVDPPDGKIPYLPEVAKRALDIRANRMADEPELHCFMSGVPHVMYVQFGFQIIQTPANVTMAWEFMNAFRIIPTDGRPHIRAPIKLFQGDSVGRWEGDTLVVDTTNFLDRTHYEWANVWTRPSETLHLVERFTRIGADMLEYRITVEDPRTFEKPWTAVIPISRLTDETQIYEYACHEGNYAMPNLLNGARVDATSKKTRSSQ
jgi:hypothetical protein